MSLRQKFTSLKILLSKEEVHLARYESSQDLASKLNNFFIAKINNFVASIDSITFHENQCIRRSRIGLLRQLSLIDLRKIVLESSSSTCPLDRVSKSFLKLFPDSYLSMLLKLMNNSLDHGVFPWALKTAVVKPYFKNYNNDCQDLANYLPISNLTCISKLLPRTILQQVRKHLEDNYVSCKFQCAYRKLFSTE